MSPDSCAVSGCPGGDAAEPDTAAAGFMLFGVRVAVDSMRKSVSLNNLSQYEQPNASPNEKGGGIGTGTGSNKEDVPAGYASADDAANNKSGGSRERKRGVPWTEEEHKLFLVGLQKVGKGDWRGISRNFVRTRNPTQVASHAQKYFLRQSNLNRRRRRSSLFDITTDSVSAVPIEEQKVKASIPSEPRIEKKSVPIRTLNESTTLSDHNLNLKSGIVDPLSLRLALFPEPSDSVMSRFGNGDNTVSVG